MTNININNNNNNNNSSTLTPASSSATASGSPSVSSSPSIIRMSTCSNDSGFEGGTAPSSPKKMLGKRHEYHKSKARQRQTAFITADQTDRTDAGSFGHLSIAARAEHSGLNHQQASPPTCPTYWGCCFLELVVHAICFHFHKERERMRERESGRARE